MKYAGTLFLVQLYGRTGDAHGDLFFVSNSFSSKFKGIPVPTHEVKKMLPVQFLWNILFWDFVDVV
jgi:hypothetical protein